MFLKRGRWGGTRGKERGGDLAEQPLRAGGASPTVAYLGGDL